MADGTIVIDTELKTDKLKNKISKLNNDIERQKNKVNELQLEYDRLNDALSDARARGATINPDDVAATDQARLNLERGQIALEGLQTRAGEAEAQLANMDNETEDVGRNLDNAKNAMDKFTKRIGTMAKKVFVFTLITKALRGIRSYMQSALAANEEFQSSLATLKGTMRTAFQPILDFVIPVLNALINVLTRAFMMIAKMTAWIFGTTVGAAASAAKSLYNEAEAIDAVGDAAKKAQKQMSGLDEMNTWQSAAGGGGAGGSKAPNFLSSIEGPMSALEIYLSGALLALGAILTFTGVSIPIGIALMALGAAGLVSAASVKWDEMPKKTKKALTRTLAVLGGAALVIGAILTFTGAALPLGIGLMVAGAGALGTAAALNWDTIVNKIRGPLGKVMALISGAAIVIGVILVFTGVGIPLGIGLILAGAAGLATAASINWNTILNKLKSVWGSIKEWFNNSVKPKLTLSFWQAKFDNIKTALAGKIKAGLNAAIQLMNQAIAWINNKLRITVGDSKLARYIGIEPRTYQLGNIPKIPLLAQGAVIPANHAFMAVLGDQKNGRNLEAPEDLIRKIVREESGSGNYTFVATLDGRVVFEEVITQAKMQRQMSGKNPYKLGAL